MQGKYHFACGIAASAATLLVFHDKICGSVLEPALFCIGSCIGSLIPDIDSPTSAIGKPLKPISKLINKGFGHRTITHSGLWLIPLLIGYFSLKSLFLLGYIIGFLSHLFSDSLTSGGIAWLYPLERKRIRLTRIKSGDGDLLLTMVSVAVFTLANFTIRYLQDNPIPISAILSLQ